MSKSVLQGIARKRFSEYPEVIFTCKLKELREAHKPPISIMGLADYLKITSTTMIRIDRGCGVRLDTALKIAKLFDLKVEDIWTPKKG
jgi:DNA-binding XRE family transcriptional regulator